MQKTPVLAGGCYEPSNITVVTNQFNRLKRGAQRRTPQAANYLQRYYRVRSP